MLLYLPVNVLPYLIVTNFQKIRFRVQQINIRKQIVSLACVHKLFFESTQCIHIKICVHIMLLAEFDLELPGYKLLFLVASKSSAINDESDFC